MLSLDGKIIKDSTMLTPGTTFRLKTIDYDAVTTITDKGYRVPEVKGNPDIIFLGDSFTYGVGLNNEETFVYIFCKKMNISCANLGMSGSGTISQLNRLERFLKQYNWRPKEVKLFIFAMTDFLSHGNDLSDILREAQRPNKKIKSLRMNFSNIKKNRPCPRYPQEGSQHNYNPP